MTLKVLILDFDGVLIESNAIKDRAFLRVFAAYPQKLVEIMAYHRSVTKIRFEKFRHIYENILGEPYTPQVEAACGQVFSNFSVRESIRCPWVKGAEDFLREFHGQVPMYLASINPAQDLDEVLKGRGIAHFFKGVHTAVSSKVEVIRSILAQEGAAAGDALFIGDSLSDHASAVGAGVPFVGRQAEADLSATGAPVFKDMAGVKDHVLGIYAGDM
jgi:phosphoglycolate phosphatase-like HAD superfamily hydrolase